MGLHLTHNRMIRCVGTPRGECGYPLKNTIDIKNKRCAECMKEIMIIFDEIDKTVHSIETSQIS